MKHLNRLFAGLFMTTLVSISAQAGVFTLTQFVEQNDWSVGLEPELTMTTNSGLAVNAKFNYGLSELSNVQFGIGPGSGNRQFRIGGAYTIDFIPDMQGQLGTGIALQGYYYKLKEGFSQTEFTAVPYLHKSFEVSGGRTIDPFISVPFGMALVNGTYRGTLQGAAGSFFHMSQNFAYSLELGINFRNTDSYLAAGVVYTH